MPLAGQPLQTERLPNGQRKLLRELKYEFAGEDIVVPEGFVTDYSSIPRALCVVLVSIGSWLLGLSPLWALLLLLIPSWHRVDLAGVLHDYAWRHTDMSFIRSNYLWFYAAISGTHHANVLQGIAGFCGLSTFGLVIYEKIKIFGHSLSIQAAKISTKINESVKHLTK